MLSRWRTTSYHNEGKTTSRCIHKGDGCNQNKTFVCGGIEAGAEGKENQRRKDQHVADGNGIKRLRIEVRTRRGESACERVARRQDTHDDHERRQAETHKAQPAMNVDAARGDE